MSLTSRGPDAYLARVFTDLGNRYKLIRQETRTSQLIYLYARPNVSALASCHTHRVGPFTACPQTYISVHPFVCATAYLTLIPVLLIAFSLLACIFYSVCGCPHPPRVHTTSELPMMCPHGQQQNLSPLSPLSPMYTTPQTPRGPCQVCAGPPTLCGKRTERQYL